MASLLYPTRKSHGTSPFEFQAGSRVEGTGPLGSAEEWRRIKWKPIFLNPAPGHGNTGSSHAYT